MKTSFIALALGLCGAASAHTIFQELYVNGVSAGHINGIRVPDYNGPITDVLSDDIICNGGGENAYHEPVSQTIIPVPAGADVITEWHYDLQGYIPDEYGDPIYNSHRGPIVVYMAKIANATQADVTGLEWFKIYEDGLDVPSQLWATDRLIANMGNVTLSIPSCIESGQYLLRAEIIALHQAMNYPGAQFYMECAQIQVTGGGSTKPATVSFPGAYQPTDPGITGVDVYVNVPEYTIPGPEVFTC